MAGPIPRPVSILSDCILLYCAAWAHGLIYTMNSKLLHLTVVILLWRFLLHHVLALAFYIFLKVGPFCATQFLCYKRGSSLSFL